MKSGLCVFAAILAFTSLAEAAIPYERAVTAPAYGAPPLGRRVAAVASNGDGALLAWNDFGRGAIYAAGIRADGVVSDPTGIRIAAATQYSSDPWLFWSGSAYLLFWSDAAGLHRMQFDEGIPRLVAAGLGVVSMASNGSRIVAATADNELAVFDSGGRLIEKSKIAGVDRANLRVVSNGHGFLAYFVTADSALYAVGLDAAGRAAGPARFVAGSVFRAEAHASNGDEYLVVVENLLDNTPMRPLRIAADGAPLETPAVPLPHAIYVALAWTGSDYLYTWTDYDKGRISGVRFDAVSGALRGGSAVLTDRASPHALGAIGGSFLLTWIDAAGVIEAEIVAPASLTHGAPALVSLSAAEQLAPRIAFSGRNYLVVWEEATAIHAMRVDGLGRALDAAPIEVATGASRPNVIFDGTAFVVAWQPRPNTTAELWLNRIDPDSGALLHATPTLVSSFAASYDLAAGGGSTMIAFEDRNQQLKVLRVDRALLPLELPLAIAPSMLASAPSIAWNGTQWLVAFEEQVPVYETIPEFPDYRTNLRAVRLSPSMTPLDTEPLTLAVTADAYEPQPRSPHAASSGDDYLIAWSTVTWLGGGSDIVARHLRPNGAVGPAIHVGASPTKGPSVVWTAGGYAVGFTSADGDALAVMLGKFGETELGAPLKISATPDAETAVALVYANGGITGAYTRVATEALYGGVSRVFVRDARPLHGRAVR